MVDNKSIMKQLTELERCLNHYNQHNFYTDEAIVVCSIIDKLLQSRKDFNRNLKHKKEKFSFETLAMSLPLEEEIRMQGKKDNQILEKYKDSTTKVHVIEER